MYFLFCDFWGGILSRTHSRQVSWGSPCSPLFVAFHFHAKEILNREKYVWIYYLDTPEALWGRYTVRLDSTHIQKNKTRNLFWSEIWPEHAFVRFAHRFQCSGFRIASKMLVSHKLIQIRRWSSGFDARSHAFRPGWSFRSVQEVFPQQFYICCVCCVKQTLPLTHSVRHNC